MLDILLEDKSTDLVPDAMKNIDARTNIVQRDTGDSEPRINKPKHQKIQNIKFKHKNSDKRKNKMEVSQQNVPLYNCNLEADAGQSTTATYTISIISTCIKSSTREVTSHQKPRKLT